MYRTSHRPTKICMIAGDNPHYVHSLVQALASIGLEIELIGSDIHKEFEYSQLVKFINLRGSQDPKASLFAKVLRIARYYYRLLSYIRENDSQIIHIQAFRFNFIEGVILDSFYRLLGKKVIYTAHNVQPKVKKNNLHYIIFYCIYRILNHIICHTNEMKTSLMYRYKICEDKISVVHHGLNSSVPITQIPQRAARNQIGIDPQSHALLIFGRIIPYKGIDIAFQALKKLSNSTERFTLLVAGGGENNDREYLKALMDYAHKENISHMLKFYTDFIPDNDIELFFESADALLLPYIEGNFQSGVLFLAYRFGLPIIASDVGAFPKEIENGIHGYIFRSGDAADLAVKIQQFYHELYLTPDLRSHLRHLALKKYSWDRLSMATLEVYQRVQSVDNN